MKKERQILQIAGLYKKYGDFVALDSIDLNVREGEFLTIVGPSGSGKTTLIKLLVGMEEQTEGSIWLRNERLDRMPANKRPTCMVFQSLALFPHRSVGQNVEFPLKIKGVSKEARKERALELLKLFRLPADYYNKRIDQCSGGERQRIALARALAFDPEILFFDEPLSSLDYRLRKTLEKELKLLHQQTGKTFIYITHSLEEAMVMSDRIAILRAGKFEQIGLPEDIYNKPLNRFVASFMGEVNFFEVENSEGKIEIPHFALAEKNAAALAPEKGQKKVLVVRPEAFRILDGAEPCEFVTEGVIEAKFLLGSRTQYEIRQENGNMIIVETFNHGKQADKGERVRIGCTLDQAHIIKEAI